VLAAFARDGIDADKLAEQLQRKGAESFVKSWNDLMLCIELKSHPALAGVTASPGQVTRI
jgi:transaldolase